MAIVDYCCEACGFKDEYIVSPSVPKEMKPPEKCPKCKDGNFVRQFSPQGIDFDVPGGYSYQYGKHAWKKHMTLNQQAQVLAGEKDPY